MRSILILMCILAGYLLATAQVNQHFNRQQVQQLCTDHKLSFEQLNDADQLSPQLVHQLFGFTGNDVLQPLKKSTDVFGSTVVVYQQVRRGIPVFDGKIVVLYDINGKLVSISGNWFTPPGTYANARLNKQAVLQIALASINPDNLAINHPELPMHKPAGQLEPTPEEVWLITDGQLQRYWVVSLYTIGEDAKTVYINDATGQITHETPLVTHCVQTSAETANYGTHSVTCTIDSNNQYQAIDSCRPYTIEVYNNFGYIGSVSPNAAMMTSADSVWGGSNNEIAAGTLFWGLGKMDDMLTNRFGRNSWDGAGGAWRGYINGDRQNASFSATENSFFFGLGNNPSNPTDDYTSLDIIGHEVAHGIDFYGSGLGVADEYGALDESFCDIFGEMLEHYTLGNNDWLTGGEFGAIRSLQNPILFGHPQYYGGVNWGPYIETHTHNGVQNHMFYLLVTGGNDVNNGEYYDVQGIGMNNAGNLAYKVLTDLTTRYTDYSMVRDQWMDAAYALYPGNSSLQNSVRSAWCAVGLATDSCSFTIPAGFLAYDTLLVQDGYNGQGIGDGDSIPETDELINLKIKLENLSSISSTGVTATLSTTYPGINFTDSTVQYADMAPGVSAYGTSGFQFTIDSAAWSGYTPFKLTINCAQGTYTQTVWIYIVNLQPEIVLTSYTLNPQFPNNYDNKPEGTEAFGYYLVIKNLGADTAHNLNWTVTCNDTDVIISNASIGPVDIPVNYSYGNNIAFNIAPNTSDKDVLFISECSADEGHWVDTIPMHIYGPVNSALLYIDSAAQYEDTSGIGVIFADGLINPGETANIAVSLKNLGVDTATNVSAELSFQGSASGFFTLQDSVVTFPDIPVDSLFWSNSYFKFIVDSNAASTYFYFTITVHFDQYTYSENHRLNLRFVPKPFTTMDVLNYTINDSLGGNNNGIAESGETVDVYVNFINLDTVITPWMKDTLTSLDSSAAVIDQYNYWLRVDPLDSVLRGPFSLKIDSACPNKTLPLEVKATNLIYAFLDTIYLPVVNPVDMADISIVNQFVWDGQLGLGVGDKDSVPETGEEIDLRVKLLTLSPHEVPGIWATLSCNDPDITITDSLATWPWMYYSMEGYSYEGYYFLISPTCPAKTVMFYLNILTNYGSKVDSFTLQILDSTCSYNISDTSFSIPCDSGTVLYDINANHSWCNWQVMDSSQCSWVSYTPGGTGNGQVSINYGKNEGAARTCTLYAAGARLVLQQSDGSTDCYVSAPVIHTSDNQLKIYPNPSQGLLNLQCPNCQTQPATLGIYTLTGQQVYLQQVNSANSSIQLQLPGGMYMYKVWVDGTLTTTDKLVLIKQ